MSWGIAKGGPGPATGAAINAQAAAIVPHNTKESAIVLDAIGALAARFGEQYPDRVITFESNGHLDNNGGLFSIAARVWPQP